MGLAALRQAKADDYILCEYIENTSNAYIDTKVFPNNNTNVEIRGTISTTKQYIFGARTAAYTRAFGFYGIDNTNKARWDYGNRLVNGDFALDLNVIYQISNNKNVITVYNESTETSNSITATNNTFTCQYTMYYFGVNQQNVLAATTKGKLYYLKIYNGETLVRDYIPMYKISTDTYGLWDRVEEKFYTSPNGVKFTGSLLFIDDYLKGMCQARWADSEGRILYTTLANSVFGEEKTKLVNKLKWVNLTSTFDQSVKLYGIKTTSTTRQADCTVNFNYNGTTNWLGLYVFYKRWGYQNGGNSYNGISSTWTSYDGYYYTIYLDYYSSSRNVKYMNFKNITGFRPANYRPTMVDVLVNSDNI